MADWFFKLPIGTHISAPTTCACGYKAYLEMEKVGPRKLAILNNPSLRCPGCGSVEITIDIEVEHPPIHA